MMKRRVLCTLTILLLLLSFSGCSNGQNSATSYQVKDLVGESSDYSKTNNWMKLPEITQKVDTFYIYPTCYADDSPDAKTICDIDNQAVRTQAQFVYE
ncbi:MAG: hypothetical protein RR614_02280, partial [Eubacterium sp.]